MIKIVIIGVMVVEIYLARNSEKDKSVLFYLAAVLMGMGIVF